MSTTEAKSVAKNHLPDIAYRMPDVWPGMAMSTREVRETLRATDGRVLACGWSYDVRTESLGAGMYRVKLVRRD